MRRRTFFGGLAAAVGAVFGTRRAEAGEFDPTKPPGYDCFGKPYCRVYREDATGVWREIRIADIKAGDRIVRIGLDGDRLWMADAMTVTAVCPPDRNGEAGVQSKDEVRLIPQRFTSGDVYEATSAIPPRATLQVGDRVALVPGGLEMRVVAASGGLVLLAWPGPSERTSWFPASCVRRVVEVAR